MNPRLIRSSAPPIVGLNMYAHLGLQDNPFPREGIINRASTKARMNGSRGRMSGAESHCASAVPIGTLHND